MFSFRLSFTIDLYTLIPVTANANKAGIKIKFWSSKLQTTKIIPFPNPNVIIVDEIAYPMQNPLKITIPNIICSQTYHIFPPIHIISQNSLLPQFLAVPYIQLPIYHSNMFDFTILS